MVALIRLSRGLWYDERGQVSLHVKVCVYLKITSKTWLVKLGLFYSFATYLTWHKLSQNANFGALYYWPTLRYNYTKQFIGKIAYFSIFCPEIIDIPQFVVELEASLRVGWRNVETLF
jgi:hypothetical protein